MGIFVPQLSVQLLCLLNILFTGHISLSKAIHLYNSLVSTTYPILQFRSLVLESVVSLLQSLVPRLLYLQGLIPARTRGLAPSESGAK